jgi:hypothetical protein
VAARLTLEGATADPAEWAFAPEEMEMVRISTEVELVPVRRNAVRVLLTSKVFVSGWNEWSRFKRFGLPHGGSGYKTERGPLITALEVLEQELEAFQADRMENKRG